MSDFQNKDFYRVKRLTTNKLLLLCWATTSSLRLATSLNQQQEHSSYIYSSPLGVNPNTADWISLPRLGHLWRMITRRPSGLMSAANILENFDNHPPLILPSSTFHLELSRPIVEPALFEQLSRLQEFIRQLPCSETQPEPDVEEQVTSSMTTYLNNIMRNHSQSGNKTLLCFYICH